jgi:hypothetical protein
MAPRKNSNKVKPAEEPEPKIAWKESEAKRLLYKDIMEGLIPLEGTDDKGKSTMPLRDIYMMRPQYSDYLYEKFSSRLSGLRKTIKEVQEPEPKITWKKSEAKRLLYKVIMEDLIPLEGTDDKGEPTMPLRDIYMMRPQYSDYLYDKFYSRLSGLRKTINEANTRAKDDEEAFKNYKQNHPPSEVSHNGCIQWQGSESRELVLEDIEEGLLTQLGKKELWGSRPEYYELFPLSVFRDKIYQELRTEKYVYTCQVRGKLHKTS